MEIKHLSLIINYIYMKLILEKNDDVFGLKKKKIIDYNLIQLFP